MSARDIITAALWALVLLATPLVFAASLYFETKNRRVRTYFHSSASHDLNPTSAAHGHSANDPPHHN